MRRSNAYSAGPVLSGRADGVSKETITGILEGKKSPIQPWVCDVRDIGRAHVAGMEVHSTPSHFSFCIAAEYLSKLIVRSACHSMLQTCSATLQHAGTAALDNSRQILDMHGHTYFYFILL